MSASDDDAGMNSFVTFSATTPNTTPLRVNNNGKNEAEIVVDETIAETGTFTVSVEATDGGGNKSFADVTVKINPKSDNNKVTNPEKI